MCDRGLRSSTLEVDGELKGPHVAAKNRRDPHARAAVRSINRRRPRMSASIPMPAPAPIAPMRSIGPTSSRQFCHGSVLVQRNSPDAMAAPAPIRARFSREPGREQVRAGICANAGVHRPVAHYFVTLATHRHAAADISWNHALSSILRFAIARIGPGLLRQRGQRPTRK